METPVLCKAAGLSKSFKQKIICSVSFELRVGEGLVVHGHNGSGKTTLLDILAGIRRKDGGSLEINAGIAYVMQRSGFQEKMSCADNMRLEAALCGLKGAAAKTAVEIRAADCGLEPFLKKRADRCSGGMRARLAIAMALVSEPGLLLLDEAFSALDGEWRVKIKNVLIARKSRGMSIIMATHNLDEREGLCERALELPSGEVTRL